MQPKPPPQYEITVQGSLEPRWEAWFAGLKIHLDRHGNTVFTGPVADQAVLHGLLARVRDLGLVLLALRILPESKLINRIKNKPRPREEGGGI